MSTGRIVPSGDLSSADCRRLAAQIESWADSFAGSLCITRRPLADLARGRYPRSLATLYMGRRPFRLLPNRACIIFETPRALDSSAVAEGVRSYIDASLVEEITVGQRTVYGAAPCVVERKSPPHSGHRSPTTPLKS